MRRLGLDLGTDSIGWVIYRLDGDGRPEKIIGSGVRIFPGGRKRKSGESLAKIRREHRSVRKGYRRRRWRRGHVNTKLKALGLLPENNGERERVRRLDPLQLRAKALDEPLSLAELGRIYQWFVKHRGFQSSRRADRSASAQRESGKIRAATDALAQEIETAGARTLGEHLWRLRRQGHATRARLRDGKYDGPYPTRAMLKIELAKIRKEQEQHHPGIAPAEWDALDAALLYQRPLQPVEAGRCTLWPEFTRAPRAHPLFQEFRIRDEVLNLRVTLPGETQKRELAPEERDRLIADLLNVQKRKLDDIPSRLGLPEGTRISLRTRARTSIDGDQTAAALRGQFGKNAWNSLNPTRQQAIVKALLDDELDDSETEAWLRTEFGVDGPAAHAIVNTDLPRGTGHLSLEAIERLLPHMRNGDAYHDAVTKAGFKSHSDFRGDGSAPHLPDYGVAMPRRVSTTGRIANPTVHIALGQLQRLVNVLIKRYGKPDEVVVEVARDLRHTPREKREYEKRQERNRKRYEEIEGQAGRTLSPDEREKFRLWSAQGKPGERICPYTGETLSLERVLSGETEIDHILPYRRSYDDSPNNKVVVMREANRQKGDRTPWEAWGGTERYAEVLERVPLLPREKRDRFDEDAMRQFREDGDFQTRQLTDTAYLSKLAREYLEQVVLPERVWVIRGQHTALLRQHWGLGEKNRNDHRHHLQDAAIIGATDRSTLQRMARAARTGGGFAAIEPPYPGFRQDVEDAVSRCTVSHRTSPFRLKDGSTTGALHKDSAYGIVSGPDEEGRVTLRREGTTTREHEDNLIQITDKKTGVVRAYKSGGNAYMDIWILPDGSTTGELVSRFQAHQPGFRSRTKATHATAKKLMRLQINDTIAIEEKGVTRILRVQQLSHDGPSPFIRAVDHTQVRGKSRRINASAVLRNGFRKIDVDITGRVKDGGPFGPDGRGKRN